MLERMWRKANPPTPVGGNAIGAATTEKRMEVSLKTKNRVAVRSNNHTPGHISGENSNS